MRVSMLESILVLRVYKCKLQHRWRLYESIPAILSTKSSNRANPDALYRHRATNVWSHCSRNSCNGVHRRIRLEWCVRCSRKTKHKEELGAESDLWNELEERIHTRCEAIRKPREIHQSFMWAELLHNEVVCCSTTAHHHRCLERYPAIRRTHIQLQYDNNEGCILLLQVCEVSRDVVHVMNNVKYSSTSKVSMTVLASYMYSSVLYGHINVTQNYTKQTWQRCKIRVHFLGRSTQHFPNESFRKTGACFTMRRICERWKRKPKFFLCET